MEMQTNKKMHATWRLKIESGSRALALDENQYELKKKI
jgi:hypothetical protein